MIDTTPLGLFIVTFVFVSLTPGLCMTLSLTLGIAIGVRRTLWMMAGELLGVGLVFSAAVLGAAAFMLDYPAAFRILTYIGGAYLVYVGWQMWRAPGGYLLADGDVKQKTFTPVALAIQGFVTAVANPKGWAFALALLPPFFDYSAPLGRQLVLLIGIALSIEFTSLLVYASGGQALRKYLHKSGAIQLLNRVAGSLIMLVGLWLALS